MAEEIKVKSLFKALRIMDCFTVDSPELGITEISEQLGLYKSNVHNIVDTFVKAGYLEQNPENEKYRLGFKLLELGNVISSNMNIRRLTLPYMQEMSDYANETVYLGMPSDTDVIYLDSASPKNQISSRSMLGVKAPLYCTGIGKAMLAFLPAEVAKAVCAKPLKKHTDQTITDTSALLDELEAIRLRGYSIDNMEHEYGIKCIGMPILNKKKQVVAGISVSGPSLRFEDDKMRDYALKLKEIVRSIEEKV
ncbi:IclR family transcriptional regulator [Paenibacillus ginsengarvi]|uniref:Glycerol operon regulatory protein n=1 Tax=Paenibacillus ginsengarvi TaxID=400777 RepID=A0A3B0C7H9_9BACL|nr:IclR family transcriptional regulator [Paenibacillus ginsengarvi]RKN80538.1 IclR family transcriptional regulator [Paenibacillus ginsengarvi]